MKNNIRNQIKKCHDTYNKNKHKDRYKQFHAKHSSGFNKRKNVKSDYSIILDCNKEYQEILHNISLLIESLNINIDNIERGITCFENSTNRYKKSYYKNGNENGNIMVQTNWGDLSTNSIMRQKSSDDFYKSSFVEIYMTEKKVRLVLCLYILVIIISECKFRKFFLF